MCTGFEIRDCPHQDEEEVPEKVRGEKGSKPRHKTVDAEYNVDYPKVPNRLFRFS